ncbi:iron complex transport system substrate-binding protein [Janthinobacterium sp. CG_23.3]|uniref:cobalamin-binding protein n=1 Tax=Janthinobacterium sp. CG_23.3 TaxID=3349634 RepID=UPI0038D3FAE2
MNRLLCALACAAAGLAGQASAAITVRDDDGNTVTLQQPARRIVALAPHVTELLFAAGGGDLVVGAVNYSDYPEAAKRIPRIGDSRQIDLERVAALKPDLLVVWLHGSSERQLDTLRKLGIPMFHSEPTTLAGIADNLERVGQLMGTDGVAGPAAAELRKTLARLATQYSKRAPVRVFYQVWDKPLYTLNGEHIVSDAIRLCGGENVFAKLKVTAPQVSPEGVLQEDPEAVVGSVEREPSAGGVNMWRQYASMKAVRNDNLFALDGNLLNRAGPRMIAGAAALCEKLDLARQRRKN